MSLVRLRTFVEVYRQRSISGAARSLNLTQPAVSQHINGLEVAIGRKLFSRESSGVLPTAAGDELASDIGDKLDSVESALANARARSMDMEGSLQLIGHADFLAEVVSPNLLSVLQSGIRVRMHTGNGDMVHNMLVEGHCDLGFTAHPITDKRLKSEIVMKVPVYAVTSPELAEKIVRYEDTSAALLSYPMLTYDLEFSVVGAWLSKNKIDLGETIPSVVSQDLRSLRNLVVNGFGWAVLPEFLCSDYLKQGYLKQIEAPVGNTELTYYMAWSPSSLRKPRIALARQTLLQSLK